MSTSEAEWLDRALAFPKTGGDVLLGGTAVAAVAVCELASSERIKNVAFATMLAVTWQLKNRAFDYEEASRWEELIPGR